MPFLKWLENVGRFAEFAARVLWCLPRGLLQPRETARQLYHFLVGSLPLAATAGVALGAVIIIVAAIVYSKRRSSSLGDEAPAGTEISGATEPAVPAELSPKEAAEVNDVPLGHAPENGALNGQVSSASPKQAEKE